MATIIIVKIKIDKVYLRAFFERMVKINEEMNEASFVHGPTRRQLQIKSITQAADFYPPTQFVDRI
jgi:hypothetical protein